MSGQVGRCCGCKQQAASGTPSLSLSLSLEMYLIPERSTAATGLRFQEYEVERVLHRRAWPPTPCRRTRQGKDPVLSATTELNRQIPEKTMLLTLNLLNSELHTCTSLIWNASPSCGETSHPPTHLSVLLPSLSPPRITPAQSVPAPRPPLISRT